MISSVIRRVLLLSVALLLLASCSRGGEKAADTGKTKAPESAPKSAVTATTTVSSTPNAAKTSKAASSTSTRKEAVDYNGITQFRDR